MQRIRAGDRLPEFDVHSLTGRRLSPAALRGAPSLLMFHRYARCAVCNERIRELRDVVPRLQVATGLRVMFVCHSEELTLEREFGHLDLPLEIVADPSRELYATFGVERSVVRTLKARSISTIVRARRAMPADGKPAGLERPLTVIPADFFVDSEGTVVSAHYGEFLGDTWPVPTIVRLAKAHAAALP